MLEDNVKLNQLEEAILKTIAFFDMFDYPLTGYEIWRYLQLKRALGDVQQCLSVPGELSSQLEKAQGIYFLPGRKEIIKIRLARYSYAERKFRRARWVVRIFKFIPWIKMIAISNLIGSNNLKDDRDIDLFVITEAKRIWMSRFFCAGIMKLLNMRPTEDCVRDKICLSFYISEENLNIQKFKLQLEKNQDDIYFNYWLIGLAPVYDRDKTYSKFMHENNWVHFRVPNWLPAKISNYRIIKEDKFGVYRDMVDMLIGGLEGKVKKIQLKIVPDRLKKLMNKDTRVVINDQVLKLYFRDRRQQYANQHSAAVKSLRERMSLNNKT